MRRIAGKITRRSRAPPTASRPTEPDMREFPLSPAARWSAAGVLALLMLATRGQHVAGMTALPDASWAVLFLGGALLGGLGWCAGLLALAGLTDYVAIAYGGVSPFCVSAAYAALAPAYAALYFAGRAYAHVHRRGVATLAPYAGLALAGAAVCELVSSGAFYFWSGRFADPTPAGLAERLVRYFPHSLTALALYLGLAALGYAAYLRLLRGAAARA
jgi:hypothetical protein